MSQTADAGSQARSEGREKSRSCPGCGSKVAGEREITGNRGGRIIVCVACGARLRRISRPYFWDANLDFEVTRELLMGKLLAILKGNERLDPDASGREVVYLLVLYVELVNASRISEAFEMVCKWAFPPSHAPLIQDDIRVRKRADGFKRLMVMPPLKHAERLQLAVKMVLKKPFEAISVHEWENYRAAIGMYAHRQLKFNSHGERYAGITRFVDKMGTVQAAKVTGHKKIDFVFDYTQVRQANEKLLEDVRGSA